LTTPPGPIDPTRSHLIRSSQVRAWLRDSVVKEVAVHRTTAEPAERILREGVDRIGRSAAHVRFGSGFYSSTRPNPHYGDTNVYVSIRLRRPFVMEDTIEGEERIDEMSAAAGSDDVRAALMEAGYDSCATRGDEERWRI
jgi:hypothetical protein